MENTPPATENTPPTATKSKPRSPESKARSRIKSVHHALLEAPGEDLANATVKELSDIAACGKVWVDAAQALLKAG